MTLASQGPRSWGGGGGGAPCLASEATDAGAAATAARPALVADRLLLSLRQRMSLAVGRKRAMWIKRVVRDAVAEQRPRRYLLAWPVTVTVGSDHYEHYQ